MKNFISKYSQQFVVATLFVVIAAGVASANWPITAGFIRDLYNGNGTFNYGAGFGIGELPGYGYGYDLTDRDNHNPADYAEYGFEGTDGSATIDNVAVTQTTATIDYSTNYLARGVLAYGLTPSQQDPFTLAGVEQDYNSGARTVSLSNLTCATTYYFAVIVHDAGNNEWVSSTESFTTSACDTVSGTTTVVTTVTSTGSHGASQPFGGVPSTTPNGDRPSFPESPRLEYSDFGPGPKLLQKLLNHLGYTVSVYGAGSPGSETEFFGPKTRAALKKFQKAHGLNPDGIYGLITKAALEREVNR